MKVNKELKGVAEEDALGKLLNSESEDEEEENQEKKDEVCLLIIWKMCSRCRT